ncbi:DEAD/DEAH box helicase [Cohnella kolymensis]|uniref:DEAD/DEAH box helicase n=1 Tax=Cohnella kolymensis TaxID=1590652 RepID=UPI000AC22DBC
MTDFADLGVSEKRVQMLKATGITDPTPVQAETIPIVVRGRDVISQAQTGTGKTLAFVLPMLDKIDPNLPYVQGLIITPTRELALQITAEVKKLLEPRDAIKVLAVYGGQDVEAQLYKLKGSIHMVIATPGRLLDHMRRETISLAGVTMLVLDEADQMLHMGFLTEVEEILRKTPGNRQTMLFSATVPPSIREMAGRILRNPEQVTVKSERVTVKDIRQWAVETSDRDKQTALVNLLELTQPYLSIIFCRTKRRAAVLNQALQELGYASDELHGDLSQAKREKVMKQFRDAKLQLLVATDVAARGLDVEGVTHVFNYDIPQDVDSYIHRIGRTGRAGESGLAITLVAPKDRRELADIENGIQQAMERRSVEGKTLGAGEGNPRGGGVNKPRAGKPARAGGRGAAGKAKPGNRSATGAWQNRGQSRDAAGRAKPARTSERKQDGDTNGRTFGERGAAAPGGDRRPAARGPAASGAAGGRKASAERGFGRPGAPAGKPGRKPEQRGGSSFGRSPGPKRGGGGGGRSSPRGR